MAANDGKVLTMTYHQHKSSTMPGLSNKAAPHCAIGGPPKSLPPSQLKRVVHFYWMKLCFLRHRPTVSDNSLAISTEMIKNNFCFYLNITVFENCRKSLIKHCERSELRLNFEWSKLSILNLAVKQCYQTGQS